MLRMHLGELKLKHHQIHYLSQDGHEMLKITTKFSKLTERKHCPF